MKKLTLHSLNVAILTMLSANTFAESEQNNNTSTQPHKLDTIVVTASGYEQKITDAPASISVITKEDLEKKPYMTLLDAVRDLEGVDVGETRDKTGQGTISIRGMGSDYTLILVNGKKQNNHGDIYPNSFGGNQFNHIPPLDAIERIEVIRGPASTLYGSDAMGGVINIITKTVSDKWSGSATISRTHQTDDNFGEDTTTDIYLTGPIIKDILGLSIRGSWYERDSSTPEFASITDPAGTVHQRSLGFGGGGKTVDNTNKALGFSLSWKPTSNQSLVFDYDISRQKYDNKPIFAPDGTASFPLGTVDSIDTIWAATPNNCWNTATCTRANPRAGYTADQKFDRDSWVLTHEGDWDIAKSFVSLAYVETNNQGRTLPFTVAERKELVAIMNDSSLSVQERKNLAESTFLPRPKRTLESNQLTFDAKADIPFELYGSHTAVVGTQITRGELVDGVFGMEQGRTGDKQENNMWSLFAEDTWYITVPFALTTGLRYDNHEVFGSQISPRLYGVYTLNDQWTLKGGISTGYKPPKTTQLYDGVTGFGGQGTTPMYGNPDLKPETSQSSELAAYWQHPNGHSFNATIFHNKFDDKISSQPCGASTGLVCSSTGEYEELGYTTSNRTVNIDEVVIQGVELAGRLQVFDNVSLRANYTYTDSEQKSGANKGHPLNESAKHMANASADWRINDQFSTYLAYESHSKRYRGVDANGKEMHYKSYGVFHLGASYKINEMFTINGRVNNLLDEDFTDYSTMFTDNGDGTFTPVYRDSYNNKDKARNYWLSLNVKF